MLDKILSFIAQKLTTKVGSFTFASGVTGSQGHSRFSQVGNVVSLQIYLSIDQTPTANTELLLGTIAGVDLPKQNCRVIFMTSTNLYSNGELIYGILNTNGMLTIIPKVSTHKTFRGNITYIV